MSHDSSRRSPGAKAHRDHILEQALKHELRAADGAVTGACLDAETLGAWADDGLDGAAMIAAEEHVSTCARCQALAGAMMKSAPATEAPVAPHVHHAAHAPDGTGTLAWWKWLAPIAAGAAAVTLWVVVPEQQQVAVAPPPITAEADRAPSPATAPPPSPPTPASPPAREQQAPRDNRAPKARVDREQLRDEAKQEKVTTLAEAGASRKEDASAAAPAPPAVAPQAPRAAAQEAGATLLRKAFAPLEVISPDPARRWRVAGGAIERSEDAGASWTPILATGGETITAGTSPAASICWLVGTNGLVLVTVDGITFARVPLPEALDITSITAADARNATVTAADGRRFRTDDSGRTWRPF